MKIRKLHAATALGSLTASIALLTGIQGAHAQGAPGAGSFPGSFLIPGTQTSFAVNGWAETQYVYDFGVCNGAYGGVGPTTGATILFDANGTNKITGGPMFTNASSSTPRTHGCSDFSVDDSRLMVQTRTPTAFGELKTFIAIDWDSGKADSGKYNSDRLTTDLREAYGTLGPLLVGQTVSNFRDSSVEAEIIDPAGTFGTARLRAPQVRYTFDFGNGLTLAAAAENAQVKTMQGYGSGSTTLGGNFSSNPLAQSSVGASDKMPDFTFKLNYAAPWGHVDLRAAVVDDWVVQPAITGTGSAFNPHGVHDSTVGFAFGIAGSWNVPFFPGDSLSGAFQYGDGATKYVEGSGPQMDVVVDHMLTLHKLTAWQAQGNYAHYWFNSGGSNLRSNIAFSYLQTNFKQSWFGSGSTSSAKSSFSSQYKDAWFGGVNLIWSPVPQVDLGVEYAYGRVSLQSSQRSDSSAINAIATFRF